MRPELIFSCLLLLSGTLDLSLQNIQILLSATANLKMINFLVINDSLCLCVLLY